MVVSFFLLLFRLDPVEYMSCFLEGGSYTALSVPPGTPPGGYMCVHTFSDGGKNCTNNDDCQGNCLITNDTEVVNTGLLEKKIVGGYGQCEINDMRYPCYPGDFGNTFSWCI